MIRIDTKENCCGCNACALSCPKKCITLVPDQQGFLFPVVNESECINCGLCEKTCPFINTYEAKHPLSSYAAYTSQLNIRMNSSSGGIFTILAENTINKGGVVFGASFDTNWQVHQVFVDTIEGLEYLRGSKYVQSRTEKSFEEAKRCLKEGRKVLYSGTPCQISGLRHYLKNEYDNLLCVDVVCHGTPSPLVWGEYLNYITRPKGGDGKNKVLSALYEKPSIGGISFRDKRKGWQKYGFVICKAADRMENEKNDLSNLNEKLGVLVSEQHSDNLYMRGFLKDLYLRPSCYFCHARCGCSGADITLGDFWGIDDVLPKINDDKGVSLILVNTIKGSGVLKELDILKWKVDYSSALAGNPALEKSPQRPIQYDEFWSRFDKEGISCIQPIVETMKLSFSQELVLICKRIGKKVLKTIWNNR